MILHILLKTGRNPAEISVLDNADVDAERLVFLALPADAVLTYKMACRNSMTQTERDGSEERTERKIKISQQLCR